MSRVKNLNEQHYKVIRQDVFRGFSDRAIGEGKRNECRSYGDGTIIRVLDAEIFSFFEERGKDIFFNVFSNARTNEPDKRIRNLVEEQIGRLTPKQSILYSQMFGEHVVDFGSDNYNHLDHEGVFIEVPVLKLPTGKGGYHSDRIHAYVHNIFERPALAARWVELPGGELASRSLKRWTNFSAPQ